MVCFLICRVSDRWKSNFCLAEPTFENQQLGKEVHLPKANNLMKTEVRSTASHQDDDFNRHNMVIEGTEIKILVKSSISVKKLSQVYVYETEVQIR